ncbi:TonB-dependent receptor [Aureibaculum sp. A20]|uniref:TonB-dependent receptor n=1 Tax=Aureibaculum flavum TaxID=2795986 RepID=A0ABS0WVT6_9FLAO|nr:TonB-dependent receptor [Aureibaculum flavum]MBJ2176117.1 TonB-dependent receptor [Aureibaculum flavum]
MSKKHIFTLLSLFFTFLVSSQEENPTTKDSVKIENLEEIIVTATRTIRQLSSLPLPAQIISQKDIQRSNSVRLNNILNEQTGLITIPDFGGSKGIQMQGLDGAYTLILVDGVPLVGRLAGTLDISRITVGNIKQIEVVRGASSSLYGSEALGGVINIITETPKNGFHGNLNYRISSFNTHDLGTTLSYKKDKLGISTFFNRYSSDGYSLTDRNELSTVDPFRNHTINPKLTYKFSNRTDLIVAGKYYNQKQDYVASSLLKGETKIEDWNTHIKLNNKYSDTWSSYFEFYATQYNANEYLDDANSTSATDAFYKQLLVRPEIRATYNPNDKSSFIAGTGFNHETLDRTDFSEKPIYNSPYAYLQYDGNPTENINIILGARFDGHSEYKSQFSPKVALRYEVNDKLALKGSIGYGFKAPDFRQLYFNFTNATIGYTLLGYNAAPEAIKALDEQGQLAIISISLDQFDSELKPENSVSIDLGFDYKISTTLKLDLNLFRNNIDDLIDNKIVATKTNGQSVFSYFNINKVYTQGSEFNITWRPDNQLKITGGYQLLYAKDKDAEKAFKNGEVFARVDASSPSFQLKKDDYFGLFNRSRHMANLKVFYNIPEWNMDTNIRGTYRSKYGLNDKNGNSYLDSYDDFVDGYAIVNVAVNKTIYKNYRLGLGIDNIFDFTDPQNIGNIPGRILYAKLNIQL